MMFENQRAYDRFHSISYPSEWGVPPLKPLSRVMSRASFRPPQIFPRLIEKIGREELLKPLQGMEPTASTLESAFQPFPGAVAFTLIVIV